MNWEQKLTHIQSMTDYDQNKNWKISKRNVSRSIVWLYYNIKLNEQPTATAAAESHSLES